MYPSTQMAGFYQTLTLQAMKVLREWLNLHS